MPWVDCGAYREFRENEKVKAWMVPSRGVGWLAFDCAERRALGVFCSAAEAQRALASFKNAAQEFETLVSVES